MVDVNRPKAPMMFGPTKHHGQHLLPPGFPYRPCVRGGSFWNGRQFKHLPPLLEHVLSKQHSRTGRLKVLVNLREGVDCATRLDQVPSVHQNLMHGKTRRDDGWMVDDLP